MQLFGKDIKPVYKTAFSWDDVSAEWSGILPEGHHLLQNDLKALEASQIKDLHYRYVSVYLDGSLQAVFYLQSLHFNRRHYRYDTEGNFFLQGISKCLSSQEADILVCGNLFRVNFQGFYFRDPKNKDLIFPLLLEYRKSIAAEVRHCGILLKDCDSEYNSQICHLQKFKPFKQDLTMELDIRPHWKNMSHYLADLSRKYRQRASKILKSRENLRVIDLQADEIHRHQETLETLYMNIVSKQSISPGILNAAYFYHMKNMLGDQFKVFGYFENDKLIAFSSQIYYPALQRMEIHYIGLDYAYNNQYNLYFNILFDGIQTAIEQGYRAIEMGRTAREAKASAGAVAVENNNYIWLQAGIIRLVFKMMSSWYGKNIGENWKTRNPFKSIQKTAESDPEAQITAPLHSI